jgi:hypothetical protein
MTTPRPEWVSKYGPSYDDIVASWGYTIKSFDTIGSYQGDHLVLLQDNERWGFIVIGYGSCSGCDTLQAIAPWDDDGDFTEVVKFAEELKTGIEWFPSRAELLTRLRSLDKANHWWMNEEETATVLPKWFALLEEK